MLLSLVIVHLKKLCPSRCRTLNMVRCISKSSSLCPHCTHICTLLKKRRQTRWQLPLFKASLMARQFLLPLGRWLGGDEETERGCWLWTTRQLQLTSTVLKSSLSLSSRQRSPLWSPGFKAGLSQRCLCVWALVDDDCFIGTETPWAEDNVSSH